MKTLCTLIAMALLAGCEKGPSIAEPNVGAEREIFAKDPLLSGGILYRMTVTREKIYIYRSLVNPLDPKLDIENLTFDLRHADVAASVFSTFLQWAAAAQENSVQPFTKKIRAGYTFRFYGGASSRLNEVFTQEDVEKFSELLKQLPQMQTELAAKLALAKQETAPFK